MALKTSFFGGPSGTVDVSGPGGGTLPTGGRFNMFPDYDYVAQLQNILSQFGGQGSTVVQQNYTGGSMPSSPRLDLLSGGNLIDPEYIAAGYRGATNADGSINQDYLRQWLTTGDIANRRDNVKQGMDYLDYTPPNGANPTVAAAAARGLSPAAAPPAAAPVTGGGSLGIGAAGVPGLYDPSGRPNWGGGGQSQPSGGSPAPSPILNQRPATGTWGLPARPNQPANRFGRPAQFRYINRILG